MTSFVARYVILWSRFDHCETGWLGNWCILVGIRYRLSYLFYTPMVTVSSCVRVYIGLIARVILYLVFIFFFFLFFLYFLLRGKKKEFYTLIVIGITCMCLLVINYLGDFMNYFLFSVSLNFILWKQNIN